MNISVFSWVAYYAWVVSEFFIVIQTKRLRRNIKGNKEDKGSFWAIIMSVFLGILFSFACHVLRIGWVDGFVANIGAAVVLFGIAFRLFAVRVLGRHFSLSVQVESTQTVIQKGPYRIIRHPAYTGALISFLGIGLALNSWVASCVLLLMFTVIYGYRIRVEEEALVKHFPLAYPEYQARTWRLIPYLW